MSLSRTSFLALLLASAACAGPDADFKDDASTAPFAEESGKADSAARPIEKGTMLVGRYAEGTFSATEGWLAQTITLTKGDVDLFASGTEKDGGTPQDTILYVYGPRRANGTYPSRAIAFNDDEDPGFSVFSAIRLNVPVDGDYRVVVSTYGNWRTYPRNTARGTWRVIAKCPRAASALACGPTVQAEGGSCWSDAECNGGLRCSGEVTCPPGAQCIWAKAGTCVLDDAWLTYAPKQCGSNPWQQNPVNGDSYLEGELGQVADYFTSKNIKLLDLGFMGPAEPRVHCLACSCARGDTLLVHATATDAARLVKEYQFTRVADRAFLATAPRQCGSNPWAPDSDRAVELQNVVEWAASQGATLDILGFISHAEQRFQCAACSCARGDLLVVRTADDEGNGLLRSLNLGDLWLP